MKMKLFKNTLLAALLIVGLSACSWSKSSRLEPGGAYAPVDVAGNFAVAPDLQFYQIDAAYKVAFQAVDTTFQFEKDNRDALWKVSPAIKKALDGIRPQAWKANVEYHQARKVYEANPVPANLTAMQALLAKMQQLSITAQTTMQNTKLIP